MGSFVLIGLHILIIYNCLLSLLSHFLFLNTNDDDNCSDNDVNSNSYEHDTKKNGDDDNYSRKKMITTIVNSGKL